MAIYKPTYCYPYGGNVDFCVDPDTKAIYLQCKLNTSNKKVTGYKLILADGEGNIIWEPKYISPIGSIEYDNGGVTVNADGLNLVDYGLQKSDDHGQGYNGDTLIIPFIQNFNNFTSVSGAYFSANCLYANIRAAVDYYIDFDATSYTPATITYEQLEGIPEVADWNASFNNSKKVPVGSIFLVKNGGIHSCYKLTDPNTTGSVLTSTSFPGSSYNTYVRYGVNYHDSVMRYDYGVGMHKIDDWLLYINLVSGNKVYFKSLNIDLNTQYSWKIILYQGEITTSKGTNFSSYYLNSTTTTTPKWWNSSFSCLLTCSYSGEYNINQYDILITQGQILGSTGERLQIYPADVILQKYYVQLGCAKRNSEGIITDWIPYSTRANIQIYDSTYGHIYPVEGVFDENILESNDQINACVVYKHSNDPSQNLESDMVRIATTGQEGSVGVSDILYHVMNGGLITIDNVELKEGDLVLLKNLPGFEYLQGVYNVHGDNIRWNRNGNYTSWSQFIGKIILVKEGTQNGWSNFQSKANVGGVLSRICGTGVNAITPSAAAAVFYKNGSTYYKYYYDTTDSSWHRQYTGDSFNTRIRPYEGKSIFITTSQNFNTNPNPASVLKKYKVTSESSSFDTLEELGTAQVGDVIFIRDFLNESGIGESQSDPQDFILTGGFLCFTSTTSGGTTTYTWYNNSFPNGYQDGGNLYFIPEQPVVLYPNYENLSSKPTMRNTDYVNIGSQIISDSSSMFQYELKVIDGNVDVDFSTSTAVLNNYAKFPVDGAYLNNTDFLGIYHYGHGANYSTSENVAFVSYYPNGWGRIGESITVSRVAKPSGSNYYGIDTSFSTVEINITSYTSSRPLTCLEYNNGEWNLANYWFDGYGGGLPYISRIATPVVAGSRIYIFNNKPDETGPNNKKYIVYDNTGHMVDPTTDEQAYYLGQFHVVDDGTYYDMVFTKISFDTYEDGRSSLPFYVFSVANGGILGGEKVALLGTYNSPTVQIGITTKTAMLNINSPDITYIKPSNNIKVNQYFVFTEVDEEERCITEIDNINYGVVFKPIYHIGSTTIGVSGTAVTTISIYTLSAQSASYWSWVSSDGGQTRYTKPEPLREDLLYSSSTLSEQYAIGIIRSFPSDMVYSSITNSSEKTPYKYKIMSYFKESDYNPITYNGNAKIGFAYISNGNYQYNQMPLITAENQSFVLDNTIYTVTIDQQIVLSSNYNPDILLRGYYEQGAGKRWEYYRMAIFDINGVLLQDTGNIYDGDFSQYFWGLRPNISTANINYALLIVEDEFGKIYTTGIKLNIYPTSSNNASYTLNNIHYNYNLQSVDIDLEVESNAYTIYRKELNSLKGMEIVDHLVHGSSDDRPWTIRDYNITNNRKYTYYINQDGSNNKLTPLGTGEIFTGGKCWSIAELYPTDLPTDMENSLTIKKKYVVDENNVWLFKYNGEFGSQTQNIAKSEQGTLGKYPRMGQGMRNNQTGSVSCLLGSEIIPGQQEENTSIVKGYQERLRSARYNDAGDPTRTLTSSNSAIDMLNAWRSFVQSKNPKLLKDVKGQSWIVQITSNQNTPMSHVQGQPDSISFSWIQIGDTKDIIITGNIDRSLTSDY